jgi:hypothetical protein
VEPNLVSGIDVPRSECAEQKYDDDSDDFHGILSSFVVLNPYRQKAGLSPKRHDHNEEPP